MLLPRWQRRAWYGHLATRLLPQLHMLCGKHGSPAFAAVARATTASTRRRCNDDPLPASPRCPLNGDVEVGALLPCKRLAKAQPSSEDASSSVEAACAARQYRCRYGSTARAAIVRATMCLPHQCPSVAPDRLKTLLHMLLPRWRRRARYEHRVTALLLSQLHVLRDSTVEA